MQLNDIRVPRAIFPLERHAQTVYTCKMYITIDGMQLNNQSPPCAAIKNTRILPSMCR